MSSSAINGKDGNIEMNQQADNKKYHSEATHPQPSSAGTSNRSRSNSHAHHPPHATNSTTTFAHPQPTNSPPPSSTCTHYTTLDLTLIRNRLRSRTFQKSFTANQLECVDCTIVYPNSHLWVCLQCTKVDASRCGRFHQGHSLAHFRASGHGLAMHLERRVIWCYQCEAEVPDDYDAAKREQKPELTPQLIRSALDKEDAPVDAEDEPEEPEDEVEEDPEEVFRAFYTNAQGGMTGLSNLGNSCFFNAGIQALLHCPPLIAFFAAPSPARAEERRILAMSDCRTQQQQRNQEIRLQLLADFSTLLQKVWSGRYHLCIPTDLFKDIIYLNPFFRGYGQHDSQELIRCMIDNLHEGSKLRIEYEYDLRRKLRRQAEEESKQAAEREKEEQEAQIKVRTMKRNPSNTSISTSSTSAASATTEDSSAPMEDEEPSSATSDNSSSDQPAAAAKKPTPPVKPRFPDCSIVSDLFQGTLESRVKCSACGYISLTRDPFYDLSLEIPKDAQLKKIGAERGSDALTPQPNKGFFGTLGNYLGLTSPTLSLETCLHSFCTSDNLHMKDQYKCDKCKAKVDAVKILSLDEGSLPEVLTLHIKRFSHNSFFGSKIGRHVTFPLYNLDVAPYLTPHIIDPGSPVPLKRSPPPPTANNTPKMNGKKVASSSPSIPSSSPALYNLFAIVRHLGSVNGGHYIAYCKSHTTGKWYEFDDKIVTEMSEEKISKIEAYVLFYRRSYPIEPLERIIKQVQAVQIQNFPTTPNPTHPLHLRYISKYWLKKMEILGRPEPIDNRDLCCAHGQPKPLPFDGGDRAIAVTPAGWDALFAEYGGGPIVDTHLGHTCEPCQLPQRRRYERARIAEVDQLASKQCEDDPFFLIEAGWLTKWRTFVAAQGDRPGPITNELLFEADGVTMRANLVRGTDYRSLHGLVWNELHQLYGGGPPIQRPTSDIYVLEKPPKPMVVDEQQEEVEEEAEEDGAEPAEEIEVENTQKPADSDSQMQTNEDDSVTNESTHTQPSTTLNSTGSRSHSRKNSDQPASASATSTTGTAGAVAIQPMKYAYVNNTNVAQPPNEQTSTRRLRSKQ